MSLLKLVQKDALKLVQKDAEGLAAEAPEIDRKKELAETGGIVFSDGRAFELIKDRAGQMLLLDSRRKRGKQKISRLGRTYVPPTVDPSLSQALILPTGRAPRGSSTDIFKRICTLFAEYGVSEQASRRLSHWTLATWFADVSPLAPCLIITGGRAEGQLVLQLLACLVRHSLPLSDIGLASLRSLPMHVQPTLLIARLSPGVSKILAASSYPRAYLPTRDGLADLYCAKAVYVGTRRVEGAIEGAFHVHVTCSHRKLPVISELEQRKFALDLQPLLLDYRIRHAAQARDSDFDVPALDPEIRILARVLGSAIIDAPELQKDLVNLLQEYQAEIHTEDAFSAQSVILEALLSYSHSDQVNQLLYIGQLADASNQILKDRGSREMLEPKALGWILRYSLGFTAKRNARGFAIKLTEDVRRRIHELARDFEVAATDEMVATCRQCAEISAADGREENPEVGTDTSQASCTCVCMYVH